METKNYAVVFPYQKLLDNVYDVIKEQKKDEWDFDDYDKIVENTDYEDIFYNVYFLREGYGDAERFENIMWYTPEADTPDKVIEWMEDIFNGKQTERSKI